MPFYCQDAEVTCRWRFKRLKVVPKLELEHETATPLITALLSLVQVTGLSFQALSQLREPDQRQRLRSAMTQRA